YGGPAGFASYGVRPGLQEGQEPPVAPSSEPQLQPTPGNAADGDSGLGEPPDFDSPPDSSPQAEDTAAASGDGLVAWKIVGAKVTPEDGLLAVTIDAAETAVCDRELLLLRTQRALKHLDLRGTSITDAGLLALEPLSQLEFLGLSQTRITDAGIPALSGLRELRYLTLAETEITDDAVPALMELHSLQGLNVKGTGLTAAGVDALKSHLPSCKVMADDGMLAESRPKLRDSAVHRAAAPELVDPFSASPQTGVQHAGGTIAEGTPSSRLSQLLEQHFSDPELLTAMGDVYRERGDLREAIASYRQAAVSAREDAKLRYKLGVAEAELGDWESSLANLSFAVGPAAAEYNQAVILHRLGRQVEAHQALRRSLACEPNYEPALEMLAWLNQPGGRTSPSSPAAMTGSSLGLLLRALQPTTVDPPRANWQVNIQPDPAAEAVRDQRPQRVLPADHSYQDECPYGAEHCDSGGNSPDYRPSSRPESRWTENR
ncbi:MAG: tetratricopeptide repeat protein, partial [Planctomycetaceae bacterium]|nr:tetratricopeptide repeat protein [Planctomycetaceae bacterium]